MRAKKGEKTGIGAYAVGAASAAMSYMMVSQLNYALTDSYAMSTVMVGMIFLFSRVFDGITDIMAGFIIDRTQTKFGKARPFDLFCIPLWILLVFCFTVPSFHTVGKVIWVLLTYNLCQSVCYTFVTVSTTVRVKRSFEEKIRVKALSAAAIVSAIASTAVSIICPILIAIFEDKPFGWSIIVSCFAVPGIIMTLIMFFQLPEKTEEGEEEDREKPTFLQSVKVLFQNPHMIPVTIVILLNSAINVMVGTAGNYYFKYIVGDLKSLSIVSLISVLGFFTLVFLPPLTKRFGNGKTVMIGFLFMLIFHAAKYLMPVNILWLAACATIASIGLTMIMSMRDMLIIDCMRFGKWKTKKNYEGIYSSAKGFSDKLALGLASVIIGIVLKIGGYDGDLSVQSEAAKSAISLLYAGLPAVLSVIGIIAMMKYKLEKKLIEIEE